MQTKNLLRVIQFREIGVTVQFHQFKTKLAEWKRPRDPIR